MSLKYLIVKTQPRAFSKNLVQIYAIGSGTYSSVFLVQTADGPMVAKRFSDSDNLVKIHREVMILSGMKYFSSIMHISDFQSFNDRYFIVSQFYGRALDLSAAYSLKQIKRIMVQLFYALSVLDALKISHRDIKPENVLLEQGCATLIDFGLAVPISSLQQRAGTMQYQAPENFLFGSSCPNSDVFSAGVLLMNMLQRRKVLYSQSRDDHFLTLRKYSPGFAEYTAQYTFNPLEKIRIEQGTPISYYARFSQPEIAALLESALRADPYQRPSAVYCLNMVFFDDVRSFLFDFPFVCVADNHITVREDQVCSAFRMAVGEFMARGPASQ